MIQSIRFRNSLCALVQQGDTVRSVGIDKKHLPAVLNGFNDIGVMDTSPFGKSSVHTAMVQEKLNECKR